MAEAAAVIRARRMKGNGHHGGDSDSSDEEPLKARTVLGHTVHAKKKMMRSQTLMDKKFKEYEVRPHCQYSHSRCHLLGGTVYEVAPTK